MHPKIQGPFQQFCALVAVMRRWRSLKGGVFHYSGVKGEGGYGVGRRVFEY